MDLTRTPFKVGDRVRINNPEHANHNNVGTIVGIDDIYGPWPYDVLVDGAAGPEQGANPFEGSELILVERPS